MIVRPLEFL